MRKLYKILLTVSIVWIVLATLMFLVSLPTGIELTKAEVTRVTGSEPSFMYIFGIMILGWFTFNIVPIILLIIVFIKRKNEGANEK